jgi:hypothetical protein
MRQIRKTAELDVPLEGEQHAFTEAYMSFHEDWDRRLEEHGPVEAFIVELNEMVPGPDKRQVWAYHVDGFGDNFSTQPEKSYFGYIADDPRIQLRKRKRRVTQAARQIVREQIEDLKHGHPPELVGHHAGETFDQLLYRFLKDKLKLSHLDQLEIVDMDTAGQKRFTQEVSEQWAAFHEQEAELVLVTEAEHKLIHAKHPEEADWSALINWGF